MKEWNNSVLQDFARPRELQRAQFSFESTYSCALWFTHRNSRRDKFEIQGKDNPRLRREVLELRYVERRVQLQSRQRGS